MKDLEGFATSELSEEGVKIPLIDVEGNPTKHWLKIKSVDSKAFKKAQAVFRKNVLEAHELENNDSSFDYSKISDKETNRLLASLVVDWSFKNDDGTEYKCNEKSIIELLEQAPVLAQEIDEVSSKRRNFIKRSLSQSENMRLNNSSSKRSQKKAKSVKLNT